MDNADDGFMIMADAKPETSFDTVVRVEMFTTFLMEVHVAPMNRVTVGMDSFPSLTAR